MGPKQQLLARYHPIPTAHATLEQQRLLHARFERPLRRTRPQWRGARAPRQNGDSTGERWTPSTQPFTFPVLAKQRSTTPEAPAYPVKHRCPELQDWQTVEWTTFHPQKAYLLQYVYGYLTQGHEGNSDSVRMNPAATEIICHGVGVYANQRLQPATSTPWASTEQGPRIHAYQPTTPCRLPCPDDHNTVIFAMPPAPQASPQQLGGEAFELGTDVTG